VNLLLDERFLQTNLVRADRTVPAAKLAGSRDLGASPSTQTLRWKSPKRRAFRNIDRLVFAGLYGSTPNIKTGKRVRRRCTQLECVSRVSFFLDVGGVLTPLLRVPGAR
jgi:hypothetical protein